METISCEFSFVGRNLWTVAHGLLTVSVCAISFNQSEIFPVSCEMSKAEYVEVK